MWDETRPREPQRNKLSMLTSLIEERSLACKSVECESLTIACTLGMHSACLYCMQSSLELSQCNQMHHLAIQHSTKTDSQREALIVVILVMSFCLQAINPKLLIFVEGTCGNNYPVELTANAGGYWWGGECLSFTDCRVEVTHTVYRSTEKEKFLI